MTHPMDATADMNVPLSGKMPDKSGGPAFPHTMAVGFRDYAPGLTMRDWFAGQALTGLMTNRDVVFNDPIDLAVSAYRMADAMLAARGQK